MLKKILYIGLISCFIGIFAQAQSTILYSTDNQISSSLINDIYQDKEGFIWISTEYGLNRFDGNKFITYNHIDEDSTSLCNDYIHQTFEDSKGNLWVSSMTGLMKYDRNTNSFTPIPLYRNQLQVFSGINQIIESKEGILWATSSGEGLFQINAENLKGQCVIPIYQAGFRHLSTVLDDGKGNWYGVIFQDRNGVGRVLTVMPCRWVDGWPMLGDENGHVPATMTKPVQGYSSEGLVVSDDFSGDKLKLNWQWNHNPMNDCWSLTERKGYLRLKTGRVVDNLFVAPNTLTQRMEGPECSGVVCMDLSGMKDGDVAGLSAFNGDAGILSVTCEGNRKYLTMKTESVRLDDTNKAVTGIDRNVMQTVDLTSDVIYLRLDGDFRLNKDMACFYYSYNNKDWKKIGSDFKMIFDYRRFFMGTKFALFNYATKTLGGFVDIDFFDYKHIKK